jgi:hypothetical protein
MSIFVALLDGRKSITLSKGRKMPVISVRSLRRYAAAGSIPGVSESALKGGGCASRCSKTDGGVQGFNRHGRQK